MINLFFLYNKFDSTNELQMNQYPIYNQDFSGQNLRSKSKFLEREPKNPRKSEIDPERQEHPTTTKEQNPSSSIIDPKHHQSTHIQ